MIKKYKKSLSVVVILIVIAGLCVCLYKFGYLNQADSDSVAVADPEKKAYIEETLNLANNTEQAWSYDASADAWILSIVSAVAYPELPDQQGVSVCVPGAYVTGIDTDQDSEADVTADNVSGLVQGALVIDFQAEITSTNGQVYTAASAPVILNTGAAGYGSQNNTKAATTYAAEGYINVACGNRGKQDIATDADGESYYTGDAPSCLVDQKAAARYVKYNILLGNLPGNAEYFVSTGGSGGGAHAVMFAATGNHSDYYDYQIEAGAVGVYQTANGNYTSTVEIDGAHYELSDGAWGCIAYSAITSLYEADMALAFEYYLNTEYSFNTSFQAQLAAYLSESYMEYINEQKLSVEESKIGFDLDKDGELNSTISLTIAYDPESHSDTNGYYGTYLDLYLAEFTQNLQWYLDQLDYSEGWTWFDETGNPLSDDAVANMSKEEKAQAFLEGRYTKGSNSKGGNMGGMPGGFEKGSDNAPTQDMGNLPNGGAMGFPDGEMRGEPGELPDGNGNNIVGTPDAGTTQSASSATDSTTYESFADMLSAYQEDIEEIYANDQYGNNIVELYHPLNYIGVEETEDPTWTKIVMGATEGDMALFSSLNLQLAWLNANVDADIEWQWDGGHVPSEILGNSFSLYVDQMYGEYVDGAKHIDKQAAEKQMENGTSEEATGTDISAWVNAEEISNVSFTLSDAITYRTAKASKAVPGFDVIDYGQEDYVFGSSEKDARHWNRILLEIFENNQEVLSSLFHNSES